jgi:hypothetical protein
VPRITDAARADFLSALVMVDDAIIALIDLANLLSLSPRYRDRGNRAQG